MATKSRGQNPVIGDTVQLELFVYNSNNTAELSSITKVDIFYLDPDLVSTGNPDGRTLVETIPGASVVNVSQGKYRLDLYLDPIVYTETGRYVDEWTVVFEIGDPATTLDHLFTIYPDLWYTTPIPIVYDFEFHFQPNKIRYGSKKYLEIEVIPNVPTATDLAQYYENLAIAAELTVSISKHCDPCEQCENDLNLVVEDAPIAFKMKNRAFYFLDTTTLDCGVYDVWFTLEFGENVYVSEKNQILIYD